MRLSCLLPSIVRRHVNAALASAALAASSVAHAQTPLLMPYLGAPSAVAAVQYPDLPGWSFFRTSSYCYLMREKQGARLLIGYNRAQNQVHLGFASDILAPLPAGTNLALEIVLVDMDHERQTAEQVRYWDALPAMVLRAPGGDPVYNFKLDGREAIISLSRHDGITFVGDGQALEGFSLRGSAAALKRLETCQPR